MKFLVILIFCYIKLSSTDPVTLKDGELSASQNVMLSSIHGRDNPFHVEVCALSHSAPGYCKAHIPRWSYDFENRECVKFIYGGCGGNKNRFGSLEECQEKCVE